MQQLYPWVSDWYFEGLPHALLADHPVDFLLRGGLVRDVVELEDLLLAVGLDHQLVFLAVRQVDAPELGVGRVGLQPDHHLHLLLLVYSTVPTH